jgi:hypothetical protein
MNYLIKYFSPFLWCTLLSALLMQCTQPGKLQTRYIPAEATTVAFIDFEQLYFKVDLNEIQYFGVLDKWRRLLANENSGLGKVLLESLQNPFDSGIDFGRKVYAFDCPAKADNYNYRGMVVALSNAEEFEEMVGNWSNNVTIQKGENDLKWAMVEPNIAVGWNKKVAMLLISPMGVGRKIDQTKISGSLQKFFSLSATQSLGGNQNLQRFIKKGNDVALWYNLEAVKQGMTTALQTTQYADSDQQVLNEILDFSGSYIHYQLNFEQGKVVASTHYDLNQHLQKFYTQTYGKNLSPELLAKIYQYQPMGVLGASWNLSGIYSWLKRVEGVEQQFSKIAQTMGLSPQALLEALQGEFALAMTGYDTFEVKEKGSRYGDYLTKMLEKHKVSEKKLNEFRKRLSEIPAKIKQTQAPEWLAIIQVQKAKVAQELIKLLGQYTTLKAQKNYHQLEWQGMNLYVGTRANRLMVSNRAQLVESLWHNEQNPAQVPKVYQNATRYQGFGYFNLNFDTYPNATRQAMKQKLGKKLGKTQEVLSLFDHVQAQSQGFDAKVELMMTNKEANSLNTILNVVLNGVSMIALAE